MTLAVVSSVAGITVAQRSGTTGIHYMQVGAGGTDGGNAASNAIFNGTGSSVATGGSGGTPAALPNVAPLKNRVDPDVFLIAKQPVTPAQVAAVRKATKADSLLQVDGAHIKLGKGSTQAVGVDPSTFRNYAPDNTAQVDQLWQRLATGDAAVAHTVGSALGVKLGDTTPMGRATQKQVRVGAFATTRLAGVGVVVDRSRSADLGLIPGAALIIKLGKDADPVAAAAAAQQAVPGANADALRFVIDTGVSGGSTVSGGVPVLGRGWTLPLRPGTFVLSQRYGVRNGRDSNGHPGIDLAAPLETPIYAASEGDVLYSGPAQGFGNWVVLQHPGGVETVYGHMKFQDLLVPAGAHVKTGQNIARVGSEGMSTGSHLHFEVHINNQRTDPIAFLNAQGVTEVR
ncbi:MAG TPA: M23 family metallopeptidase [Frankiaceae bacterium]|nr:M23 family metallopeptidase [Frankiaceae bacterium]